MSATRYQVIDLLRGLAIVLMIGYHFTFDLDYFALIDIDFNHDPLFLGFRSFIVSMFLLLVGISLHLATRHGLRTSRYLRRLVILIACAALVSLGSYLAFPQSMIFFGILHFIALASIVGLLFVRLYWANLLLGCGLIVLGLTFQQPLFDHPVLQWIGLMTHKPVTEDYVPFVPWFGMVLIGLFLGKHLDGNTSAGCLRWHSHRPLARVLVFAGRHSLLIYMLHQPLLIGILYLLVG